MSYFDDASLVMIPSGYKTSKVYSVKPTSGDGDLTFTRSNDTATRVGPDGLIEKVRTNLILQSNTFNTTWATSNATITGGQAGYDGTNNAWLLDKTGANGYIGQIVSYTGLYTQSIYVKAGTSNWLAIQNAGLASSLAYFDLQNGVVGTAQANVLYRTITSVGSGWYRCSVAYNGASGQARFFVADSDGVTSGTSGNILIQAAQFESGDIMTDYIATTSAAVSVGPVANVPRLDYLNSSCPRLLLEPQRTNLITFSEQLNNAAWQKTNVSVTANTTISPDGYTNADTITGNGGASVHDIWQGFAGGTSNSVSFFVKKGSSRYVYLTTSYQATTGDYATILVDLDTQSVINSQVGNVIFVSSSVVNYGNGWYRITSNTTAASATNLYAFVGISATFTFNISSYGRQVSATAETAIFYGIQAEASAAYATSYIPTLGAAVTRGVDGASKTGISSLINSVEGTIYFEASANALNTGTSVWSISNGTAANTLYAGWSSTNNSFVAQIIVGGAAQTNFAHTLTDVQQLNKFAVVYKNNDHRLYINGVLIATDNVGSTPVAGTFDRLLTNLGQGSFPFYGDFASLLLFPTALSDADCIALTA